MKAPHRLEGAVKMDALLAWGEGWRVAALETSEGECLGDMLFHATSIVAKQPRHCISVGFE